MSQLALHSRLLSSNIKYKSQQEQLDKTLSFLRLQPSYSSSHLLKQQPTNRRIKKIPIIIIVIQAVFCSRAGRVLTCRRNHLRLHYCFNNKKPTPPAVLVSNISSDVILDNTVTVSQVLRVAVLVIRLQALTSRKASICCSKNNSKR